MATNASLYTLNYHACTIPELRTFITSRTGQNSPTNLPKDLYIRRLRKLDNRTRFRFISLSPELRGRVYRNLLIGHKGAGNGCFPQILATCKFIHREGTKILYTEHIAQVHISAAAGLGYYTCSAQMRELVDTACLEHAGWGEHLLRVVKLDLVVDITIIPEARGEGNVPVAKRVNNLMYSLANYLAEVEELREVVVRFRGDGGWLDMMLWAKMLWPLTRMRRKERRIKLVGAPEVAARQVIAGAGARSEIDAVNLVKRYWALEEKVKDRAVAVNRVGRECCALTEVGAAAMRLEDMALGNAFVDRQWEDELLQVTLQMEELLG